MEAASSLGEWFDAYVEDYFTPLKDAYDAWKDDATRTRMIVQRMDTAVNEFRPLFREFYDLMTGNPLVTDTDLTAMGFPVRYSGARRPAPAAAEPPGYNVEPALGHILRIHYYDMNRKRKRTKPDGQHGVEIKWCFEDMTPSGDPEQFLHSTFDTSSPAVLTFDNPDSGRGVRIALRWENTRGQKGPWSIVETIHVP
jgi:hypothetical protein